MPPRKQAGRAATTRRAPSAQTKPNTPKVKENGEAKKSLGAPRVTLGCEHCGRPLFTAVVRVYMDVCRVQNAELKPVSDDVKARYRPGERAACPDCNKVTDLCLMT